MVHQHSEEDLKAIAKQLGNPEGEHGVKTGEAMNVSNIGMTQSAINALKLRDEEMVLEIGHGNGGHIADLLGKAAGLQYFGADISATIIAEAERLNRDFLVAGNVKFNLTNGTELPFANKQFNKIFTVNTIYFWENHSGYLAEIMRILKPGGTFVLCFADKSFMEKLPFTKYGFNLYELDTVTALLKTAGFNNGQSAKKTEQIKTNSDLLVDRDYFVISASR